MDYGPLALLLALVFAVAVWWLTSRRPAVSKKRRVKSRVQPGGLSKAEYQQHWQRLEAMVAQPGTESTKAAIIEADKLVDMALRQMNFPGDTMGERLKQARGHFNNNAVYQGLWEAHKMRNALAHELSFDVPKSLALRHLDQFKAALQYLRLL